MICWGFSQPCTERILKKNWNLDRLLTEMDGANLNQCVSEKCKIIVNENVLKTIDEVEILCEQLGVGTNKKCII